MLHALAEDNITIQRWLVKSVGWNYKRGDNPRPKLFFSSEKKNTCNLLMSSSFIIKNLDRRLDLANSSVGPAPLGGLEDTYVRLVGDCHPDFTATPIGPSVYGVKICRRRSERESPYDGERIGTSLHQKAKEAIEEGQGYHRVSVNLYDTTIKEPRDTSKYTARAGQEWNPQLYSSRRMPYEQDLLRSDYLHWPIRYSGTGIQTLRTPTELGDTGKPYLEYGLSFSPQEDVVTGFRNAKTWTQTQPQYKYDVTRLIQPYTSAKRETRYMSHQQDKWDTIHNQRIV
jgi:hypothetical protein